MQTSMNHLTTIAARQRNSRARDALFAVCVAIATIVSIGSVAAAANAAAPSVDIVQR